MRADQVLRIVSAYEGQLEEVGFTIAVYSNSRVSWIEEISQSLYSKDVKCLKYCLLIVLTLCFRWTVPSVSRMLAAIMAIRPSWTILSIIFGYTPHSHLSRSTPLQTTKLPRQSPFAVLDISPSTYLSHGPKESVSPSACHHGLVFISSPDTIVGWETTN